MKEGLPGMQSLPNSARSTFSAKVGSWSKDIYQKIILSVARRFKPDVYLDLFQGLILMNFVVFQ